MMKYEYQTSRVKDQARGRWAPILQDLAPALTDAVDRRGKHVPSPVHGGRDGFRVFPDCYVPPYSRLFLPTYSGVRQRESPTL